MAKFQLADQQPLLDSRKTGSIDSMTLSWNNRSTSLSTSCNGDPLTTLQFASAPISESIVPSFQGAFFRHTLVLLSDSVSGSQNAQDSSISLNDVCAGHYGVVEVLGSDDEGSFLMLETTRL